MVFTKGFVIHHEQRQRHQCLLLFWKTANSKGFLYCFWTKQKLKQLFQFQGSSNDYYLQQIGRWVAKQKHLEIGLKPLVWCPGFFWGLQSTISCTAHILPLGRSWKILHYTYIGGKRSPSPANATGLPMLGLLSWSELPINHYLWNLSFFCQLSERIYYVLTCVFVECSLSLILVMNSFVLLMIVLW